MREELMSLLGKLCKLFDFDEVEIDEDNRDDFDLVAVLWQDYSTPNSEEEQRKYFVPDRVYFHLFEDQSGNRCCYMNICGVDIDAQNLECNDVHLYNLLIIPWLAGKLENEDMEQHEKKLKDQAFKEKTYFDQFKPDADAKKTDSVDDLCSFILYGSMLGIVAPIADQLLKDYEAGKVQLNGAEVTEYMVRAYKMGLLKGHSFNENEADVEKTYVIQLLRDVSNWFTADGTDAAVQNYQGQTLKYRTSILKEVHELLVKLGTSETAA